MLPPANAAHDDAASPTVPPPTSIRHIQHIGEDLGIPPEKLTVDLLMVDLANDKTTSSDD